MQNVTSVIISSSPPAAPVSIQLQDAAKLQVTWLNVLAGFSLLLLDIVASSYFKLGLSKDLLIAAARCVAQLTLLGTILRSVFNAQSPVAVAALSLCEPFFHYIFTFLRDPGSLGYFFFGNLELCSFSEPTKSLSTEPKGARKA